MSLKLDGLRCVPSFGRLEQAQQWLEEGFALGDAKAIKLAPLEDPDLKPRPLLGDLPDGVRREFFAQSPV